MDGFAWQKYAHLGKAALGRLPETPRSVVTQPVRERASAAPAKRQRVEARVDDLATAAETADSAEPLVNLQSSALTDLSATQRLAVAAVATRQNVFITGRAGCGKSKILTCLIAALEEAGTPYAATASTGIAAEPLGGSTLHAFACLNPSLPMEKCKRFAMFAKERISKPRVLIVDEVSMVSAELLGQVIQVLRHVRGSDMPVLVLCGDFLQLAPVDGTTLLESAIWKALRIVPVVLTDNWRQKDSPDFVSILDESRFGELQPSSVELLSTRVGAALDCNGVLPTTLMSHRRSVADINMSHLEMLPGDSTSYVADVCVMKSRESGGPGSFKTPLAAAAASTDAAKASAPEESTAAWVMVGTEPFARGCAANKTEELADVMVSLPRGGKGGLPHFADTVKAAVKMVKDSNMSACLILKVGAQVMFTSACFPGVVNGSRGVVTSCAPGRPIAVTLVSGLEVHVGQFVSRRPLGTSSTLSICMAQIPLILAWAITIHKSQGMSLDLAEVDIGRGVFATGQAYVALSRLRTLEGLCLKRFEPSVIKADPAVVAWYKEKALETACGAAASVSADACEGS